MLPIIDIPMLILTLFMTKLVIFSHNLYYALISILQIITGLYPSYLLLETNVYL